MRHVDCVHFYPHVCVHVSLILQVCHESMDYLVDQIRAIEPKLESYQQLGLPMQIIHGDLHFDNVLVLGDSVNG